MNGPSRRRLRGRADALLDRRSRTRAGERRRPLRRLRLGRRRRPPSVARLQVDQRRRQLDDPARRHRRGHTSRTTAPTQCSYDNVIEADPTNPNIVFAAGQFDYGIGSGGIFRSDDGGQTWKNLGWDQHPDFHALAFDPANTAQVAHRQRRRRLVQQPTAAAGRTRPIRSARSTWAEPERHGRPDTAAVIGRSNLAITQFTSIATVPQIPLARVGASGAAPRTTARCASRRLDAAWFDVASGDGGQVLVDPTPSRARSRPRATSTARTSASRRTGTPTAGDFFTNQFIRNGIDLNDRSDFYIAVRAEPGQPEPALPRHVPALPHRQREGGDGGRRQVEGDQRRPDHRLHGHRPERRAELHDLRDRRRRRPGRVHRLARRSRLRQPGRPGQRQPDLDRRPTRTRTCRTGRSRSSRSTGATTGSPTRPSTASTTRRRSQPGHVFRTLDGGKKWTDITGNLPDTPGQLDRPRPVVPEHALRGHRRRAVRDLQRRHGLVRARHGLPARRDLAARPRPGPPACSRPARTAAARST